jgi:hypothetical protein
MLMVLKKLVHKTPVARYVDSVREGSRIQEERAAELKKSSQPVINALREYHSVNHFSQMVANTFGARR